MNKKTPKGTIDLFDESFREMGKYKNTLENLFIAYGGVGLETPVFEIRENLLGKYGEEAETKLIFNLEDCKTEKGEKYTLRYDLTIPKMRFIRSKNILSKRIYSIGKVYRRDNPSIGRYREFYQADFDIIGESSKDMINEFVLLKMASEFLRQYGCDDFTIYLNDTNDLRYLLVDRLEIEPSLFKSICSTIDKLDKCTFDEIIPELLEKGMPMDKIETLNGYLSASKPILPETEKKFEMIVEYANTFDFGKNIVFSSSLARGLDYYNGIIFEIKMGKNKSSIISGGRYDDLIPSKSLIGISFGLTRIADLFENTEKECKECTECKEWNNVFYFTLLDELPFLTKLEYIKKCETLFNTKMMINSEQTDKKLVKVINYCLSNRFRYLVILGENEIKDGKVILKDLMKNTQTVVEL